MNKHSVGVYEIYCVPTQKIYIGSTSNSFYERWRDHRRELDRGTHTNQYLQNAWNKYGGESFQFLVLENMDAAESEIRNAEQWYLDNVKTHKHNNGGYNISLDATAPMRGRKMPAASVEKRASMLRGKKRNPEHINRGRDHHWYGKRFSEEHKRKLSENHADMKGENAGNSKLKDEQVLFIRNLFRDCDDITYTEVAKMVGVYKSTVSDIVNRRTWVHI